LSTLDKKRKKLCKKHWNVSWERSRYEPI
jgi:hypothetical protein